LPYGEFFRGRTAAVDPGQYLAPSGRRRKGSRRFFLSGNLRAAYRITSKDCSGAECVIWISVSETGIPEILSSSLRCGVWSVVEGGGRANILISELQTRTGEQSIVNLYYPSTSGWRKEPGLSSLLQSSG